ncbi:MAG: benzylsuccinate CoA-transferase BbsF subunit [Chloroflexi bacterium]|jgi:benzylsuccinate CoA-transferase BbsF subunit|nr:MAG: benzylsuccinate CoA-transferase BbsF subunit [Chloroflexota bacterium]
MTSLPLNGIRIIDLTRIWAGPRATKLLADMGAQVIKIEHLNHADRAKPNPTTESSQRKMNRATPFEQKHRNKIGLSLDLSLDEGKTVFRDLVSISDVVIENFSAGVMNRLGLGHENLKALKPDIITVSMPGFGNSGPWKDYVAYGVTQEQITGLYELTGYKDGLPMKTGTNVGDPMNATHAAIATLSAVVQRLQDGQGEYVDFSQYESFSTLMFESIMNYAANGILSERKGNESHYQSPHDTYQCKGTDEWVTIAISNEEEWRNLCEVIGKADVAKNSKYSSQQSRHDHRKYLNYEISKFTKSKSKYEIMNLLQARGVPCTAVLNTQDLLVDEHVKNRNFIEHLEHPDGETHKYYFGSTWRENGSTTQAVRSPAPLLGEHNGYICAELLGISNDKLDVLAKLGLFATFSDN